MRKPISKSTVGNSEEEIRPWPPASECTCKGKSICMPARNRHFTKVVTNLGFPHQLPLSKDVWKFLVPSKLNFSGNLILWEVLREKKMTKFRPPQRHLLSAFKYLWRLKSWLRMSMYKTNIWKVPDNYSLIAWPKKKISMNQIKNLSTLHSQMTPVLDLQPTHDLDVNKKVPINMLPCSLWGTDIGRASESPLREMFNARTNCLWKISAHSTTRCGLMISMLFSPKTPNYFKQKRFHQPEGLENPRLVKPNGREANA